MNRLPPSDPFDPANLSIPEPDILKTVVIKPKLPRHHKKGWFLRGPIPWQWLAVASVLPGKALVLSLVLWREAGRKKSPVVRLRLNRAGLGLNKRTARRALRALESVGLVSVVRRPGRCLEVTLLDLLEKEP